MGHCDFEKGSRNQHFQSTPLVGRKGQNSSLCTLLIMFTILDDPLVGTLVTTAKNCLIVDMLIDMVVLAQESRSRPRTRMHFISVSSSITLTVNKAYPFRMRRHITKLIYVSSR